MVIKLEKKLNLFVPALGTNFESFNESFDLRVDSVVLKDVDADAVRERILAKRPDLSNSINGFMPTKKELKANGEEMKDIEVIGFNGIGNKVSKTISLNRLLSYDKNNTFDNVHMSDGEKWILSISKITFDKNSKTVIFE